MALAAFSVKSVYASHHVSTRTFLKSLPTYLFNPAILPTKVRNKTLHAKSASEKLRGIKNRLQQIDSCCSRL